jgi:hypothetical protein
MPGETPTARLPSPWKDFLGEIDKALEKPLEIHCIGGFALIFYYGEGNSSEKTEKRAMMTS